MNKKKNLLYFFYAILKCWHTDNKNLVMSLEPDRERICVGDIIIKHKMHMEIADQVAVSTWSWLFVKEFQRILCQSQSETGGFRRSAGHS